MKIEAQTEAPKPQYPTLAAAAAVAMAAAVASCQQQQGVRTAGEPLPVAGAVILPISDVKDGK